MSDLSSYISSAASYFNIPPDLFAAQLQQESGTGTNLGTIGNIGQVTQPALTDVNAAFGTSYTEEDLASSPQIGIDVAAAFDSLKLQQNGGSFLGMLQSYGTLPSSPLSYTPSQEQLAEVANNYDTFGSGQAGSPVTNPSAPLSGIAGAASNSGVVAAATTFLGFITSGQGWERIGVIVIGIVLLCVAGFMLATKGFEGTIKEVVK